MMAKRSLWSSIRRPQRMRRERRRNSISSILMIRLVLLLVCCRLRRCSRRLKKLLSKILEGMRSLFRLKRILKKLVGRKRRTRNHKWQSQRQLLLKLLPRKL